MVFLGYRQIIGFDSLLLFINSDERVMDTRGGHRAPTAAEEKPYFSKRDAQQQGYRYSHTREHEQPYQRPQAV